jgi:hypothetical protein
MGGQSGILSLLGRSRAGIGGTAEDDWNYAERQLEIRLERMFLEDALRISADTKEKIALATTLYIAEFMFIKPSEAKDELRLGDALFLEKGFGMSITCAAIGELSGAGKLNQPETIGTVGELIASLQAQCKVPVSKSTKRRPKRKR